MTDYSTWTFDELKAECIKRGLLDKPKEPSKYDSWTFEEKKDELIRRGILPKDFFDAKKDNVRSG